MSFIFFDTETTGLHAGFDQIVQFAAVRTDNDLNETDRFELRSRIDPNVVPDVQAMLANGLSIEELTDQHLSTHYQMMRDLNERLVSWSPAIFLGYNSIRFDEEFLRHALYRTLHPPYLTSLHGNGRNDVMSLALSCSASGDNALRVPLKDSGDPSLRLHDIAAANGIAVLKAHDAMFDTQTTLELCRLVKKLSPDLWRKFVRFSNKASVADFVTSDEPFVLTEFYGNSAYHTPVVFVANEPDQPNGMLCLSLVEPIEELASMSDEQLASWLLSPPRPIRRVRSNAGPTMMPLWEASEEIFVGTSCEELEDRAARIVEDEGLKTRIERVFSENRAQYPEPAHVEEMLYTKFSSRNDATLCDRFHSAPWSERRAIARAFEDDRLKELALRICHFECRSALAPELVQAMDVELAHRLMSTDARPPSVERALKKVEEGRASSECEVSDIGLLEGYGAFLSQRRTKIMRFLEGQ